LNGVRHDPELDPRGSDWIDYQKSLAKRRAPRSGGLPSAMRFAICRKSLSLAWHSESPKPMRCRWAEAGHQSSAKMLFRYSSWTGDASRKQGAENSDSPWSMFRRFKAVYLVPSSFHGLRRTDSAAPCSCAATLCKLVNGTDFWQTVQLAGPGNTATDPLVSPSATHAEEMSDLVGQPFF
jgi:hypothetical protein